MSNFELIDDYLTNRLECKEKEAFEQQLASDPTLKTDVDLQRHILEGIKNARALELKSMLSKVPVSSGFTFDFTMARIAAGIVGAGVVFASVYFFTRPDGSPNLKNASADLNSKKTEVQQPKQEEVAPVETPKQEEPAVTQPERVEPAVKESVKKKIKPKKVNQPRIEVVDPSEEMNASGTEPVTSNANTAEVVTPSRIEVTTDTENKKYAFHYQFTNGRLYLYGPFDRSLYEILEINGETHSVFLYNNESFYMLNEKQQQITRLEPITDNELIKKLKEYRSK